MGIFNSIKNKFFSGLDDDYDEYDEYYRYEEIRDFIMESEDDYESVTFGRKKAKNENEKGKEADKKRTTQEEKKHLNSEEAKYDRLLNAVQAQELSKALALRNEASKEELRQNENIANTAPRVFIDNFNREDVANYVKSQCEVMEEAAAHIDMAKEQYEIVTEHFNDIELFEAAPEGLKKQIEAEAEIVDNLLVDRRIFRTGENKLSNSAYHRIEMYEDEFPGNIKFVEKQETIYETIKHDMRVVQGEQMALRLEARGLKRKQRHIKSAAFASLICLAVVFAIVIIAMVATEGKDESNTILFIVITALSAVLAIGMLAMLQGTHRKVVVTEIKLNKAINMLNKIKIKYVNAANVLDYEYGKYKVKNSYEMSRKYEVYLEMKQEQKNLLEMTSKLSEAEERLMALLKKVGMQDCNIWASQVRALYNRKEMVEIRHELASQRQKLRDQMEYNERKIEEAKNNIKDVTRRHPSFTDEALKIIDEYERRNRKR